jgi:hypothetical protein
MYVINYSYYIYIVCYYIDIFLSWSHLEISIAIIYIYTWSSVQGYSWCYWIIEDSWSMARIPVQHLVLSVGKTFVIFVFCLFNSLCLLFICNIIFYLHDVYLLLEILMLLSSIGYYRVFALNFWDSSIFILDPMTTRIIDKEDRMKQFSRVLKQIEENIARVVTLKHLNYEGKIW